MLGTVPRAVCRCPGEQSPRRQIENTQMGFQMVIDGISKNNSGQREEEEAREGTHN